MRADMDNYLVILCILLPVTWSQSQSDSALVRINISPQAYKSRSLTADIDILSPQSAQYEQTSTKCLQQCTGSCDCSPDLELRYQTSTLCYYQITQQSNNWSCAWPSTGMLKAVIDGRMNLTVSRSYYKNSITVSVSCISSSDELFFNQTKLKQNLTYWRCKRSYYDSYHYCKTSYSGNRGSWTDSVGSIRELSCRPADGSVSVRVDILPPWDKSQYLTSDVEILSPQSAQYEKISTKCLQQCNAGSCYCSSNDLELRYQTRTLCYEQVISSNSNCTSPYTGMLKAVIEGRMELEVDRSRDKKSVTVSVSCIRDSYKLLFNGTEWTRNTIFWNCTRYRSSNSYDPYCWTSYSSSSGSWTSSPGSIGEFSCRPVPQPTTQPTSRTRTSLITQSTTQPATTTTTIYPTPSSKSSTAQTNISTTTQPGSPTPKTSKTPTLPSTYSPATRHGGTTVSDENSTNSHKESTSEGVNGLNGSKTESMNSNKGDNSSVGLISGISAAAVVVIIIIIIIITVLLVRRRKSGEQDNRDNVVTHQNNVYESDYTSQPACDTEVDDDNYNILHHRVRVRNDDIYQEGEDYFQLEHSNGNRTATGSYHLVEPPQWTNQNADQEETTPKKYRVVRDGEVEELYSEVNKDDRAVGQASTGDNEVMVENDIYEGAQVDDEEVVYSLAE